MLLERRFVFFSTALEPTQSSRATREQQALAWPSGKGDSGIFRPLREIHIDSTAKWLGVGEIQIDVPG